MTEALVENPDTKVYFGNLPFTLTDEALRAFAAPAGSIVSAEVIKYGERSKGFGFVTYNTKEEAAKAIETLNDKDLEGRPANVKLSKPKTDAPKPKRAPRKRIDEEGVEAAPAAEGDKAPRGRVRKPKADGEETTERAPRKRSLQPRIDTSLNTALYVANLPFKVKSADLHEIFKDFKVKQAYVVTKFGRSKGFGFVELESTAERDRVLTEVTGAVVNDREIVIKPAMPKPASEEVAA